MVFDDLLVMELVLMDQGNVAIVDRFQSDMDGTVILADGGVAKSMVLKADQGPEFDYGPALKTVNIYRLSRESLVKDIVPKMEEFLEEGRADQYYEAVFADLISTGRMNMAVMNIGNKRRKNYSLLPLRPLVNGGELVRPACTAAKNPGDID